MFDGIGHTFQTVAISLLPLVVLFAIFQFLYLKLPIRRLATRLFGLALALFGIALFLQGVKAGFLPAGTAMGEILGAITSTWLLIPFGVVIGFLTAYGEPAVHVLADQVEDTSAGSIKKSVVLYTISVGVALFVGLAMARLVYGIPLMYIVVPGYLLALALLWRSDKTTVGIAFDAGGVATGPMAVTFLLAVTVGIAASMEGRDPVADGFGLIALIALAPIISILSIGLLVRLKLGNRRKKKMAGNMSMILTIVKRGWGDRVLEATMKAGAGGGTIFYARGVGIHEQQKILGIAIEPEKEVVLTMIQRDMEDHILETIEKAAELDKPGNGLAFVLPVEKLVGVIHLGDKIIG